MPGVSTGMEGSWEGSLGRLAMPIPPRPLPEQASTPGGSLRPGSWTPLHEDINRVEERKHGFKTSVKKLLQRRASPRHSPPGPLPARGDSLKRQKGGEGEEGGRRRYPRSFSFKGLLRRKGLAREEQDPHPPPSPSSLRPTSLPVTPCYCTDLPALGQQDPTAQGKGPQRHWPGGNPGVLRL